MDSRRLLILGGGLLMVIVIVIAAAALMLGDSGDGSEADDQARNEDTSEGGGALGICLEGATDCVDTIVEPDGGAPGDQPTDPDSPVVNEPGTPSGDFVDCTSHEYAEVCESEATKAATGELAARLDVGTEAITRVSIESSVWDGCLGVAPVTGEVCTEIGIIGYKIILEHAGVTYEYHTDTGGRAVLVE